MTLSFRELGVIKADKVKTGTTMPTVVPPTTAQSSQPIGPVWMRVDVKFTILDSGLVMAEVSADLPPDTSHAEWFMDGNMISGSQITEVQQGSQHRWIAKAYARDGTIIAEGYKTAIAPRRGPMSTPTLKVKTGTTSPTIVAKPPTAAQVLPPQAQKPVKTMPLTVMWGEFLTGYNYVKQVRVRWGVQAPPGTTRIDYLLNGAFTTDPPKTNSAIVNQGKTYTFSAKAYDGKGNLIAEGSKTETAPTKR